MKGFFKYLWECWALKTVGDVLSIPSKLFTANTINSHQATGVDINIHTNKWDIADSTSIVGIACLLSLHWRYIICFLGKVFFKNNSLTKQSAMYHWVDFVGKKSPSHIDHGEGASSPCVLHKPTVLMLMKQPACSRSLCSRVSWYLRRYIHQFIVLRK